MKPKILVVSFVVALGFRKEPMKEKRSLFSKLTGLVIFVCPAWFITSSPSLWHSTTTTTNKQASSVPEQSCDISRGNWIYDPSLRSLYTNNTCEFIQPAQNCAANGRPDVEYLNWRWKPEHCELHRFDPDRFLNLMRGKKMLIVGDSLARNHHQSLLCSLSQVEIPREFYARGRKDIKLQFPEHGFVLAIFWSPLLVKHRRSGQVFNVDLDIPELVWASEVSAYDVVMISAGQWFFRPSIYRINNATVGRNEQLRNSSLQDLKFTFGLKTAFRSSLEYVLHNAGFKGLVILRTAAMSHFEHGQWSSGGTCNRTIPNQSSEVAWTPSEMRRLQIEASIEAVTGINSANKVKLRIMDITRSMFLRPDGHPGQYRGQENLVVNDCLHWCLPGPIDMWNEMLLHILQQEIIEES